MAVLGMKRQKGLYIGLWMTSRTCNTTLRFGDKLTSLDQYHIVVFRQDARLVS